MRRRAASVISRVLFAVTLLSATPIQGITSVPITLDGVYGDWAGPFSDPTNMLGDTIYPNDPDNPNPAQNRDLVLTGYTYDATNAYFYMRRTTAGSNRVDYTVYVDRNGDGIMGPNDYVAVFALNGSSYNAGSSGLFRYVPVVPAGDVMGGDGESMPGYEGAAVPGAVVGGFGSGVEFEGSVRWTSIGLPVGAPLGLKFNAKGGDNTGILDTTRRGVSIAPDRSSGGTAGSTAVYTHTVTNSGNATETILLEAVSSRGWVTEVRDASGVTTITSLSVPPGASRTIVVRVDVPLGIADGTRDVTTVRATLQSDPAMTSVVRDTTSIGPILVIPNREGAMAPGQIAAYTHTITNNTDTTRTVALSTTSDRGWYGAVFAADGVTPLPSMILGPGASTPVVLKVSVPATATVGTLDVTTLRAEDVDTPTARGTGTASTTVRAPLQVEPNRTTASGPGTVVWFEHTVTNSWPTTRSVSLSAANTGGWTVSVYNASKSVTTSTVTLAPQGGSVTVQVRVNVPAGAAEGAVTTTTLSAASAPHTASVTGVTTVRRLTTYADAGYASRSTLFRLGETVYARAGGLTSNQQVTFRWVDPTGAIVYTSPTVTADTQGTAVSFRAIAPGAEVGDWTLILRNNAGVEITRSTFTVAYNGTITHLSATDADPAGRPTTLTAGIENRAGAPMAASTLNYLVWWDADGNGVFGPGDTWADDTGTGHAYVAPGAHTTRQTSVPVIPANSSWAETPWSIPSADLPFAGTWRVTANWVADDGRIIDTRSSTFTVKLATFAMGISANSIDFGVVDPGTSHDSGPITITINASEPFDLTKSVGGSTASLGLTSDLGDQLNQPSGPTTFLDRFRIDVPWSTDPGPYTATVTYTIVAR